MEHFYKSLPGQDWFTYQWLYSSVVNEAPHRGHFVEVGSFKGRSASHMAVEIINSGKNIQFDCVDHWKGSPEHLDPESRFYDDDVTNGKLLEIFKQNTRPVKDFINVVTGNSVDSADLYEDNSLDFVFIDADHSYEAVIKDIQAWLPKVKPGGLLAGHDYYFQSVYDAINGFFYDKQFQVRDDEDCWQFRKLHPTKRIGKIPVGKYHEIESIFCINTKERYDRRAKICALIEEKGLPIEFFDVYKHPNPIQGCAESHLQVISLAKNRGIRRVMVLEDDVEFCDSFWELKIELPENFNILHFGGIPIETVGQDNNFTSGRICCAHAYILNHTVFNQVLAHDCKENIDIFYSKNLDPQLSFLTRKNHIIQAAGISDADRLYKWANKEWETLDLEKPILIDEIKTIPNIIHFIHFQETEFYYFHLLSIKQAIKIQKPEKVYLHLSTDEPGNQYLEEAKTLCSVNIIEKPETVNNKNLQWYQHKADVARLDMLYKFGGVYLDIDYFLTKDLFDLMGNYVVMCKESEKGLFNGVIMCVKECEFIKEWRDSYDSLYGELDDWWTGLSIRKPMELAKEKYPSVTILEEKKFLPFMWEDFSIYEKEVDLSDSYGFHMWQTEFLKRDFITDYLFPVGKQTTFSKLLSGGEENQYFVN